MDTTLTRHLPVATCIGCGARSHSAECAEGCSDLPLDLVDVDDLVAIATRVEALEERVAALREVIRVLASDGPVDWPAVQARARRGGPRGHLPVGVPVDDDALRQIARLSGGQFYTAHTKDELRQVYATLRDQIGYETRRVDDSSPWLAGGAVLVMVGVGAGLRLGRRLP